MPSFDQHSLLAYSTLTNSPGTAGTSFTVQTGEGARFAVGQQVTYWPANVIPHKGNAEVGLYWLLSSSGHEHRHHGRVSAGATAR